MTQQTTNINQPELEQQNKNKDGDGDAQNDADDVVKALEDAIARGDVEVQTLGENVVVNFTTTEAEEKDLPQLLQQTLNAIERPKRLLAKSDRDVLTQSWSTLQQLAKAASDAANQSAKDAESQAESKQRLNWQKMN